MSQGSRQGVKTRESAGPDLAVENVGVYRRLRTVTAITFAVVLLVAIHEGFVLLSLPAVGVHSWAHVGLIVVAFALGYGLQSLWRAYDGLQDAQRGLAAAYRDLDRIVESRTRALVESESLLNSLFHAFRERTLVVDRELRVVNANAAAAAWLGRDPHGLPLSEMVSPSPEVQERRSMLGLLRYTFATGKPQRSRLLWDGPDGRRLLSLDTYPLAAEDGSPKLVLEVARDITEESQAAI
jgi:PAS domain-containing protein